jgi:hypothetical protein
MTKHVITGIVLALVAAGATPASAQQTRPFRGLFGAQAETTPPQSLDFSATLFGVDDTNMPRLVARDLRNSSSKPDVRYTDLHTGLWYTKRAPRTSFSANGMSSVQYYPQLSNVVRWSGAGAVAVTHTGRRVSFGLDQQVRYSPYSHFRVIPIPGGPSAGLADVSAPDAALAVTGRESYRYNTGMSAGIQIARRAMLSAAYQHEYLDFLPVEQLDWRTNDASVTLTHNMTSKTALVAGYAYHHRDFQGERRPLQRHDLNFGVNYNSALPFSPRTTFTFNVGSTALSRSRLTATNPGSESTFFRVIGGANLEHQLARNWHAGLFYGRGVQYIEGVSDVFLADSVTGNVRGYFGPRVEMRVTSGYSTGPLRFGPRQRGYDTNASTARMRIAISRSLAAQAEYVHYRYLFSDAVTLPTGIPSRANRHVIRVGLTTWVPLLQ